MIIRTQLPISAVKHQRRGWRATYQRVVWECWFKPSVSHSLTCICLILSLMFQSSPLSLHLVLVKYYYNRIRYVKDIVKNCELMPQTDVFNYSNISDV